jgi:D-threo-aldose 1-dehydrogenase
MYSLDNLVRVGSTDLMLPPMGQGCGTLGDPDTVLTEDQAQNTLAAAWVGGLRYFDTAPWYGTKKSEHRAGPANLDSAISGFSA